MNAEDLVITFKRDMAKLSGTERRRAIESVRDVIRAAEFDDAAGSAYEVERCPRCGSAAVVKKGKSKNGEQRYLCRGCGRTFGMGSGRILGTSRLPRETWMAYAECFVLMLPLRECARRCRVCLKTAYTMRHRLIECLSAYTPSFRAGRGCGCELDETYFPESFKGNHAKGSFKMPRPSRRRGKQVHRRGLSLERICVMTGVNDSNETFLEVTGRGALSRKRAMDVLRGRIAYGSVVATDRAAAYVGVLAELGVAAHAAYDPKDRSEGTINRINTVHSLLGAFMEPFRGVSTKHLGAYLAWFRWCRTFMATDPGTAERTVARQLANGTCGSRIRDMFNVRPPYMDYWDAPAAQGR